MQIFFGADNARVPCIFCSCAYKVIRSSAEAMGGTREYRESLTDVVVQHMITGERVRIRCRDSVLKLAVLVQRLAVLHPDRVTIFQVHDYHIPTDVHCRCVGNYYSMSSVCKKTFEGKEFSPGVPVAEEYCRDNRHDQMMQNIRTRFQ